MPKRYIFVKVTSGNEYDQMIDMLHVQGYHWRSQSPMHANNYWYMYEKDGWTIFGIDSREHEVWHDVDKGRCLTVEEYDSQYHRVIEDDSITDMDSII